MSTNSTRILPSQIAEETVARVLLLQREYYESSQVTASTEGGHGGYNYDRESLYDHETTASRTEEAVCASELRNRWRQSVWKTTSNPQFTEVQGSTVSRSTLSIQAGNWPSSSGSGVSPLAMAWALGVQKNALRHRQGFEPYDEMLESTWSPPHSPPIPHSAFLRAQVANDAVSPISVSDSEEGVDTDSQSGSVVTTERSSDATSRFTSTQPELQTHEPQLALCQIEDPFRGNSIEDLALPQGVSLRDYIDKLGETFLEELNSDHDVIEAPVDGVIAHGPSSLYQLLGPPPLETFDTFHSAAVSSGLNLGAVSRFSESGFASADGSTPNEYDWFSQPEDDFDFNEFFALANPWDRTTSHPLGSSIPGSMDLPALGPIVFDDNTCCRPAPFHSSLAIHTEAPLYAEGAAFQNDANAQMTLSCFDPLSSFAPPATQPSSTSPSSSTDVFYPPILDSTPSHQSPPGLPPLASMYGNVHHLNIDHPNPTFHYRDESTNGYTRKRRADQTEPEHADRQVQRPRFEGFV